MISANECREITMKKEAEQAQYEMEQRQKIRDNTLEFCNTVISDRLKSASQSGLHSITLNFFKSNWYDSYQLAHKINSYWHIDSYQWRNIDTIKEMAEMHGYKVDIGVRNYPKSSKSTEVGTYLTISW